MGMSNSKKLFNKYFLENYPFWDPEEAVTEKILAWLFMKVINNEEEIVEK